MGGNCGGPSPAVHSCCVRFDFYLLLCEAVKEQLHSQSYGMLAKIYKYLFI